MEFNERLKMFRESIGIFKKRDMSDKLEISESFYNKLENGKAEPSKKILRKLVVLSNKPEEYWVYGVEENDEFLKIRPDFKCSNDLYEQFKNMNLIGLDKEYTDGMKEIMIAALIADYTHRLELEKLEKEKQGI